MKRSILLALLISVSNFAIAGTYYDSVIECASENSEISNLTIQIKNTGLYKKDRAKGTIEFADLDYIAKVNESFCQYQTLKLSLSQYKMLVARKTLPFSFSINMDCSNAGLQNKLAGQIIIDSTQKFVQIVRLGENGIQNVPMKCEVKSLLDRVTDALVPEFGS